MRISIPCTITPRLLPGVEIGGAYISIDYDGDDQDGRTIYKYYIDTPDYSLESSDLKSGCQGGNLQEGLCSLLSFLEAFAEGIRYQGMDGRSSENADLFPPKLAKWANENSDEITGIGLELEENDSVIDES